MGALRQWARVQFLLRRKEPRRWPPIKVARQHFLGPLDDVVVLFNTGSGLNILDAIDRQYFLSTSLLCLAANRRNYQASDQQPRPAAVAKAARIHRGPDALGQPATGSRYKNRL